VTRLLAADAAGLAEAVALLAHGALVAFGTETVYGLGADATNERAVADIFAAKGRPHFNPLICHYANADAAWHDVIPNKLAEMLAASFWPGPLTLVLPRRPHSQVALLAGAGLDTLAVRVPAHPVAHALATGLGRPIAAPSANRSGQVSPTTARHVLDGLAGRIAAVVECGPCAVGLESTILDLSTGHPALLRAGGVAVEAIEAVIGPIQTSASSHHAVAPPILRSPGLMASHYAPALPVRIDASTVAADEALLAFGQPWPGAGACFNLSLAGDLHEAAARLFAGLRLLDATGARLGLHGIVAMPIPAEGLGLAINDRLSRAAAPR
jgi:L-threonylcarbamoyladenylate synthase